MESLLKLYPAPAEFALLTPTLDWLESVCDIIDDARLPVNRDEDGMRLWRRAGPGDSGLCCWMFRCARSAG